MADLTRDEVKALARTVGLHDPVTFDAMTRLVNAAIAQRDSAWWALVMGAAASIEDAANCLRDPDAKKQADGAAKHYREAAQKLAADGVMGMDGGRDSNPRQLACARTLPTEAPYSSDRDTCFGTELPTVESILAVDAADGGVLASSNDQQEQPK